MTYHYQDLIILFNGCFLAQYNTRLAKGEDEPLYQPANELHPNHTIFFAHGFFRSALHECAHWFIAGEIRRKLLDFGYWYAPDGRTAAEQTLFQQVELKPQALEWILTQATGHSFHVSIDNLTGDPTDAVAFEHAVLEQVQRYCKEGLPTRAAHFREALCWFYDTPTPLLFTDFDKQT